MPAVYAHYRFGEHVYEALNDNLKSLIEPFMIILLAVIVGVVLLAVIVPMFSFYGEMI